MKISDFNYPLPDERIAKYPLAERDSSKLLIYKDGNVSEDVFRHLPDLLPAGELMIFNNTKVIQARLHFHKETGALIEVFCLEPHTPHDYQLSFAQTRRCSWTCLIGNAKKWKEGRLERIIRVGNRDITLTAERGGTSGTGFEVIFDWQDESITFAEVLDAIGELPIPPYLNRNTEESDLRTYQTVYSKIKGSVAAPTAGLHFTDNVLQALDEKGIDREEITLHVGAGTFKPVKTEEVEQHEMHAEWIAVNCETINKLLKHNCQCIVVGTTSVRTLESLYYLGRKVSQNPELQPDELHVNQWEPYEQENEMTTHDSLNALITYMDKHQLNVLHATTQIMIKPGFTYRIVNRMVTNFHQPQSTLLLLVSAFVGGNWRTIYDYALAHDFRFLSYGDSCLLIRE
ncbi:MAG: S-adenosylmethionine:tRNA ribosyltransferase-isomerase [Bacteroidaceae bacterium]|nr:S-adenosylmethionine:tRNA ribosyltransferase-isomerase [Bacteroidaceae bacterium]MBQ7664666.1 S-adenosylmethionine:tRNA ribosyltransferase-isomerase [Bacteroidaceae bacterium]